MTDVAVSLPHADSRVDRLSLLADIATRLLMHDRPEEIAGELYRRLAAHLNIDVFFNYLVTDDRSGLELAASDGVPDEALAPVRRLAFGQSACGTVALRRSPIIAERVLETEDSIFAALRSIGVQAYACHPLLANGQLLGTLAFASRAREAFLADEIQLMATVANQAAMAIERARLLMAHAREFAARQQAESTLITALADSETRLRTVLDIMPVGVFIADAKGRVLLVNRAGRRIWGDPPLVSTIPEYARYQGRMVGSGRRLEAHEWGLPQALAGTRALDRAIEIEAFDGTRRTILNSALPIRDASGAIVGAVAVDVDITERMKAEESVRRSEAILNQAGKMAGLGAWELDLLNSTDPYASPLRWSDQVFRIFGYEPGELAVTNDIFFSHVPAADRAAIEQAVKEALAEKRSYSLEHRIVRRDGTERVVYEHADIRFNDAGDPVALFGAVQDITERKRAEEALVEADRRKNAFLAMLSHELRNPLAPIRYALQMINTDGDGQSDRAKAVIERQLLHLVRLVDDLLDLTRITSNKVRLRRTRVDLRSVVDQALDSAQPAIRSAEHELVLHLPSEAVWVDGDPDRLAQVVTNLLNNAARYTPAGGRITVAVRTLERDVEISVADTGVGLAAEDLPRVFDMFTQVGEPGRGGLGIGLALVKGLVDLHGGRVEARSAGPGSGSQFVVLLPRADRPAAEDQAAPTARSSPASRTILVVDDNNDAAEMMAALLQMHGHTVHVAHDAVAALQTARRVLPDVGLFDIGLPGISGYQLARSIREDDALRRMYLVAVTGWGQEEDRRRARDAGFDAHLTKPAAPEAIEQAMARATSRSPRAQSS